MNLPRTPAYRALAVGAAAGVLLVGAFMLGASRDAARPAAPGPAPRPPVREEVCCPRD